MTESAPAPVPAAAPAAKWNVLSIVSLVSAVIGLGLVAVITGHISLGQIKKTGEQGNVLAIIGLILGYLEILATIIFFLAFLPLIIASTTITTY